MVLTTSRLDQDVEELYAVGVNSYIQKPSSFDEFTAALRDLSSHWLNRASLPAGHR